MLNACSADATLVQPSLEERSSKADELMAPSKLANELCVEALIHEANSGSPQEHSLPYKARSAGCRPSSPMHPERQACLHHHLPSMQPLQCSTRCAVACTALPVHRSQQAPSREERACPMQPTTCRWLHVQPVHAAEQGRVQVGFLLRNKAGDLGSTLMRPSADSVQGNSRQSRADCKRRRSSSVGSAPGKSARQASAGSSEDPGSSQRRGSASLADSGDEADALPGDAHGQGGARCSLRAWDGQPRGACAAPA